MSQIRKCIVMMLIIMMFKIQVECIPESPYFKTSSVVLCKTGCFFKCSVGMVYFADCFEDCCNDCKHKHNYDASHK